MKLFTNRRRLGEPERGGIMDELERVFRRARAFPLAAPFLLLVGFGVGEVTKRSLSLPDAAIAESSLTAMPRVRLEALSLQLHNIRADGAKTVEYVKMYREHILPVEKVLQNRGVPRTIARQISWPLVEQSYDKGLDPAMVVSILLVESDGIPTARSSVGARGLMQVMPGWAGRWEGCGRDLYNVKDNLCNGTSILKWYLDVHRDERKALLGYNGCVNGTNTPNCHIYPNKIWTLREQIARELGRERARARARTGD